MIKVKAHRRVRNVDTVEKLKGLADHLPLDPASRLQKGLEMVTSAMEEIHGGKWRAKVDHQKRAILVWENWRP